MELLSNKEEFEESLAPMSRRMGLVIEPDKSVLDDVEGNNVMVVSMLEV